MNKKFLLYTIIVLLIATTFYLWFFSENTWEIKKPTAGDNIIVFGDSLAEGVGSSTF